MESYDSGICGEYTWRIASYDGLFIAEVGFLHPVYNSTLEFSIFWDIVLLKKGNYAI